MFDKRLQLFLLNSADELLADRLNRELEERESYLNMTTTGEHYVLPGEDMHSKDFYNLKLGFQFLSICELTALVLMRKLAKLKVLSAINVIAGPRRGAGPLIQTLAHYLPGKDIRTILLDPGQNEEREKIFTVEPHTLLTADDRLLYVDDAFSTGRTTRLCIDAFERFSREKYNSEAHPEVVAVGVAVNRAPESWRAENFMPAIPFAWGIRNPVEKHPPATCPACRAGVKLVEV